jgi:SnoaL-like domain
MAIAGLAPSRGSVYGIPVALAERVNILTPLAHTVDGTTRAAVEALIAEHSWLIDHGQADQLGALYTVDGSLTAGDVALVGRDAISEWGHQRAQRARSTLHTHPLPRLILLEPGVVAGWVPVIYFEGGGTTDSAVATSAPERVLRRAGEYRDRYVFVEDRWLISERQFVPLV